MISNASLQGYSSAFGVAPPDSKLLSRALETVTNYAESQSVGDSSLGGEVLELLRPMSRWQGVVMTSA